MHKETHINGKDLPSIVINVCVLTIIEKITDSSYEYRVSKVRLLFACRSEKRPVDLIAET